MTGWYRALLDVRDIAFADPSRPISVEVTVGTVGSLGTFKLLPRTGLSYSGRHRHHCEGN